MSQVSPPLRIALVAIALLGAVWFVALRPKPESGAGAPPPVAPGVKGLTSAVGKATAATKAANASVDRSEAAASAAAGDGTVQKSVTAAKTASGATVVKKSTSASKSAAKASAPRDPAAPLIAALKHGRVVVLMFRNASTDSGEVAAMVRTVGKRRKVVARVVSIHDVGRYDAFTAQTPVAQAPTTLVIGPRKNAKVIVGFTSVGEIAQAVADVRRAGHKAS